MKLHDAIACALLAAALLAWPSGMSAQWVEPKGQGWASLSVFRQDTRDAYDVEGDTGMFPAMGRDVATGSFLTLAVGLLDGLDAWAQFSFQRLRFDDLVGRRTSTGFGDVRLFARTAPLRALGVSTPLAIRAGVKVPVGDFDVGSNMIPLGDGQRDWELMLELGHSFYPAPTYVMGWIGYRWREEATEDATDFGDERFFYAAVGGEVGPIGYKAALEGWYGATPVFGGFESPGAKREMIRFNPSLLIPAGPGQIEVGVRWPLAGKNLPAGKDLVLGYFTRLGF